MNFKNLKIFLPFFIDACTFSAIVTPSNYFSLKHINNIITSIAVLQSIYQCIYGMHSNNLPNIEPYCIFYPFLLMIPLFLTYLTIVKLLYLEFWLPFKHFLRVHSLNFNLLKTLNLIRLIEFTNFIHRNISFHGLIFCQLL